MCDVVVKGVSQACMTFGAEDEFCCGGKLGGKYNLKRFQFGQKQDQNVLTYLKDITF